MSALAMLLTAAMAVPGTGPEKVSGEVEQGLDLRGRWRGTITTEEGKSFIAVLESGYLVELEQSEDGWAVVAFFRSSVSDEGGGRFRLNLNREGYAGIYKWDGDNVVLCFRPAEQGRPSSFRSGDGQSLLILRRVKPRK